MDKQTKLQAALQHAKMLALNLDKSEMTDSAAELITVANSYHGALDSIEALQRDHAVETETLRHDIAALKAKNERLEAALRMDCGYAFDLKNGSFTAVYPLAQKEEER